MKKTIKLIVLSLIGLNLIAQNYNKDIEEARNLFESYDYQKVVFTLSNIDTITQEKEELLAKSFIQLGQLKSAESQYKKLIEMDKENRKYKNELAKLYVKSNKYKNALEIYESLSLLELENPFYKKKIADMYSLLGDPVLAVLNYNQSLKLNPLDVECAMKLSDLMVDLDQFQVADSILSRHYTNDPKYLPILHRLLKLNYKQHKYKDVVDISNRLFAQGDSSLLTKKILGICAYRLNDYVLAIELLEEVVEAVSNKEVIHFYLGLAYKAIDDLSKAEFHLEKAIDEGITENIESYYTQLGATYERQGNFADAIRSYRIAYEKSNNVILLYHLARNYDQYYKDKDVALDYYLKYLSYNDTMNKLYYDYSKHRVGQIRSEGHFLDTLN